MKVELEINDFKRYYQLTMSRAEFLNLRADITLVAGMDNAGTEFFMYAHPSDEITPFKLASGAYHSFVGAKVPLLPPNVSDEEFDRLAQIADDNLEKALNSTTIPMLDHGGRNVGYVNVIVEK